jgi:succinate dehydrogenase hydrophobic anchor subunit
MSGAPIPARRYSGRPDDVPPGYVPAEDLPPTMDALRAPTRAGAMWLVKAVSGVALIGFLGLHLVAQHVLVEGGLRDFDQVVAYLRHPLALTAEIGLLAAVIVHAALGVRAILVDILPGERAMARAEWVIRIVALLALAYGIGLTIAVLRG